MCFHAQAHKTNDGSLANSMFLPLAEKLMEKYVLDKKLDIEEGTRYVYVHVCIDPVDQSQSMFLYSGHVHV